jgi:glycosyltransferase involved in cell wall biosynthesis
MPDLDPTTHPDRPAMPEPRVDIVIPVYGPPDYLAEAIDSALAQTFRDFRVVVLQHGPGEEVARAIVERYAADPRVEFAPAGRTLTAAENFTRCIRAARAPYVAMLHEDDRYHPDFLARRVAFLDAHPECGFVYSSMRDIDEHGSVVWEYAHQFAEGVYQPRDYVPHLLRAMIIGSPTPLVRLSAYEDVGMEFTGEVINRDWDMWLRIALRHPVGYLAVRDCDRRVHRGSVTAAAQRGWGEENLRLVDRFEALVAAELPDVDWPERDRRRRRADGHLTEAFDAVVRGEPRTARCHVRAALGHRPAAALDPRAGLTLVLAASRRGPALITGWRRRRGQQRFGWQVSGLRRLARDVVLRAREG